MLVNSVLEGLFPTYCELCGLPSHRDLPLCECCEGDLAPNRSCCHRCALPLPPGEVEERLCGACQQRAPGFDRVIAPWLYSDHLAHLIHRWKYGREVRLTTLLARLFLSRVDDCVETDLLVPVPLHWRKLWHRGFNQSEVLSSRLLRLRPGIARLGVDHRLARRCRATLPQSGMDALNRRHNLRDAFTTRRGCASLRVAIVDDVLTTGATADALAGALRRAGACQVDVWCLARTPPPGG